MTNYCIKYGIPYDVAHSMGSAQKIAHCIVFGEFEGGTFDWTSMAWVKRD